ncbi:hypothetical protein CH63R_04049 [Colletotrichum higginsianum IMI 349063]|uniref:Uncharacterized protein n=1 Tax=Colletotrichum higginsianum (strain IMI 349063) TaxID=759273 RepID=A0A1B7YI49_COLHI|nr:hypothetical protein CH63R_04049 [Colletotrichum higginsianum IMI 349063]OBR11753.1 hypothetical protein CH63R_04049 [Colletotrichum higginsianum IMI 349063]
MSFPKHNGGEQHRRAAASMNVTRKPRTDQSTCFRLIHLEFHDSVTNNNYHRKRSRAKEEIRGMALSTPGLGCAVYLHDNYTVSVFSRVGFTLCTCARPREGSDRFSYDSPPLATVLADQGESDALGDVEGPAARSLPGVGLGRLTTPGGAMDVKYLLPPVMDVVPHNIDINCICRFSKLSSANDAHDVDAGCMVLLPLPASRWCQHEAKHGSVSKIDYNSPAGPQIDGPRLSSPSKRTQHFSVQTIGRQGWFSMPASQQRPYDPLLYDVKCRCDASL